MSTPSSQSQKRRRERISAVKLLRYLLAIVLLVGTCVNIFWGSFYYAIGWTSSNVFESSSLDHPPVIDDIEKKITSSAYIDASVILSGVGKGIQPDMARTMVRKLRYLGRNFRKYHIVIYENNSNEASKQAWNETFHETFDKDFTFLSENVKSQSNSRPARIARARNVVLTIVHEQFSEYDYMIVTDLDGCCDQSDSPYVYNPAVFRHAIHKFGNEWDALSFRGHWTYWDRWAFREEHVMPYNMASALGRKNAIQTPKQMDEWVLSLDNTKLTPVLSAFMMISIYRINATVNCKYSGVGEHGEMDCEHVAFHRNMREKNHARIRLWPVSLCHNMSDSIEESERHLWDQMKKE